MSFLVKPIPDSMSGIRKKFLTGINVLYQRHSSFIHGNDRGNRNFGPIGRGNLGRGVQNVSQDRRQNLENNPKGVGRGSYNQG